MSRHRYVRNLDLDAEMEDDVGGGEQPTGGMTAEEHAQMAITMPIARALLKDVKPPISEESVADSLWHYWFDVEKAVSYLRKDWEKKGGSPPQELLPTPEQQRRRRSAKSIRTTRDTSPQPPLSALQRLSLARKEARSSSPLPPASFTSGTSVSSSSISATVQAGTKPMSKLALLAQKRKEAAQPRDTISNRAMTSPGPVKAADPSSSSGKPLSKLAQKMAAARSAGPEPVIGSFEEDATSAEIPEPDAEDLETSPGQLDGSIFATRSRHTEHTMLSQSLRKPSPFFKILTSTLTSGKPPDPIPDASMHLPLVRDPAEIKRRVRHAFGPGVDSPDDVVLRARQGRVGAAEQGPKGSVAR